MGTAATPAAIGHKMSWNYRIVKHPDGTYGIHEAYYNDDGEIWALTEKPATGFWDDPEEAQRDAFFLLRAGARETLDLERLEFAERISEREIPDFPKILLDTDDEVCENGDQ